MNSSTPAKLPNFLHWNALPLSISALKEVHCKKMRLRWGCLWHKSPRFNRMNQIDSKTLQQSFMKLTADFPKKLTGLYMAIHTGHAPLNKHLHHIGKVASSHCPHCKHPEESVLHYLTVCPQYQHEHHIMTCALGCRATSIPFLLSDPDATPHLVHYVNTTGKMKTTFGEVPLPHLPADR
jgi:hypothetical protein